MCGIIHNKGGEITKDRIKQLRKYFNLSQTDFGERIGAKQTTIAGYETGIRSPSDVVIMSICREFKVNESWLRDGQGPMFIEINSNERLMTALSDITKSGDNVINSIIIAYTEMPEDKKQVLREMVDKMLDIYQETKKKEQ